MDDSRALLGDKAHFVDGFFGADFVDDTNEGVGDSDKDKEEIFVAADNQDHYGEDEVDEVEDGEGVSGDNSADRVGLLFGWAVDFALLDFFGNLIFCEPSEFHKEIIARKTARGAEPFGRISDGLDKLRLDFFSLMN